MTSDIVSLIVISTGTAVLSCLFTLLLTRLSVKLRLMAIPVSDRWHQAPTPNTGGLGIFLACTISYLLIQPSIYKNVVLASGSMALLGAIDDRLRLRPILKLGGQCAITCWLISTGVLFRPFSAETANFAITFVWLVGVTNAFNLIDNMDGLCAGVVVITGISRCIVAFQSGDTSGMLLAGTLVGGFCGFLVFNFPPAKIFMGDAGSMFGGFALAALTIAGPVPKTRALLSALLYPALTFLYPIFDTTFVSILRRAAGRPISVGGRDHTSHRLVSLGHHERNVVFLLWAVTATGAFAGLFAYWFPLAVHIVGGLLIAAVSVFGIFLATLPRYALPDSAPVRSAQWSWILTQLRATIIVIVEALLAGIAIFAAFLLRWESAFNADRLHELLLSVPIVVGSQIVASAALRTFRLGWRWFGAGDSVRIAMASILGTGMSAFVFIFAGLRGYSRSVLVMYALLSFAFSLGLRLALRTLWELLGVSSRGRKAALAGHLPAVSILYTAMTEETNQEFLPVLVLSTDPSIQRTTLFGIPVHSIAKDPLALMQQHRAECLVTVGNAEEEHPSLVRDCLNKGIPVFSFNYSINPVSGEASKTRAAAQHS